MKTKILFVFAGLAVASALAGCSSMGGGHSAGEAAPSMTAKSAAGTVLTNQRGMTLYTYDEDDTGTSNCTGMCAAAWPPVYASADATPSGHLTIIARPDGSKQWAQDGKPLYTYQQDKQAGDIRGEGVEGTWHLVRPE